MLDYLVTSKTRRRLLTLLFREGERGGASALAESASVSFSTVHAELQLMREFGLATVERKGGVDVYAASADHPHADLLRALVSASGATSAAAPSRADAELRAWLADLGVPLRAKKTHKKPPSPAEVLFRGAMLARRDPTCAHALPVGFHNLRDELDTRTLLALARRPEDKHTLGFFLELTGELGGERRLVGLAEMFRDRRMTSVRDFFLTSQSRASRRLAEKRTPAVAARWGFRMNLTMDAFSSLFDKFVPDPA